MKRYHFKAVIAGVQVIGSIGLAPSRPGELAGKVNFGIGDIKFTCGATELKNNCKELLKICDLALARDDARDEAEAA